MFSDGYIKIIYFITPILPIYNKKVKGVIIMKEKFLNAIAYIVWTLSLYVLSYYSVHKDAIDIYYQIAAWFMIVSCISLYKKDYSELTIELIKIICLAIGNLFLTIKLGDTAVDIYGVIYLAISTVCNALICYFFIWYTKHTYNLHGEKGYKLEYLSWIIFAMFAFVLKYNIVICFIIFCVFNFSYGYKIWLKKELQEKQEKMQAENELKEKRKMQKERRKKRRKRHKKGQTGRK